jgi:large subunit ribosomal protein L9
MEIILLKNVESLGRKGDLVRVKKGYGRNFILPRNLGLVANAANQAFVKDLQARAQKRKIEEKKSAEVLVQKLEKASLKIAKTVGENEKLFGSVTSEDIREALTKLEYSFSKKQIQLKEPIKSLGVHTVVVEVYPQVKATVSVEVIPEA